MLPPKKGGARDQDRIDDALSLSTALFTYVG